MIINSRSTGHRMVLAACSTEVIRIVPAGLPPSSLRAAACILFVERKCEGLQEQLPCFGGRDAASGASGASGAIQQAHMLRP